MKSTLFFLITLFISLNLGSSLNKYTIIFENRTMDESYEKSWNLEEILEETSGLAFSLKRPQLLYQINDSGNEAILYRTRLDGTIESSLKLANVGRHDFESISLAKCGTKTCIYIFDTGDNLHIRSTYSIYKLSEEDFEAKLKQNIERIDFNYPSSKDMTLRLLPTILTLESY